MTYKGDELKFYDCPECGKRRLLWKKEQPPRSTLVRRTYYGVVIKEHSVICNNCHKKYSRRRREIEREHYRQLKEEQRGDDKAQTILDDGEAKP